jgi:hypothetical protein
VDQTILAQPLGAGHYIAAQSGSYVETVSQAL